MPIYNIAFSPDGKTLAGACWDSTVRLWDAKTGELKHRLTEHKEHATSVAFSPDGTTLASGGGLFDNTVRLWDPETGELKRVFTGHMGSVQGVAFSPDGGVLASGSGDGTVLLWKVTD